MVAATINPPRPVSRLTQYDHNRMVELYCVIRQLALDDALDSPPFWVERTILANGYAFFAVFISDVLFGIVDIRGDVRPVQKALTAYLWHFGMRHENARLIIGGAKLPAGEPVAKRIDGEIVYDVWKHRDSPKLFDLE